MILRDYQVELVDRTRSALRAAARVLVQAPTGAGKTAMATHIVRGAHSRGLRTIFIVHRRELLKQTAKAYERAGLDFSLVQAGEPFNPRAQHFIANIGSIGSRASLLPRIDLATVDEAHHAVSPTWRETLNRLEPRFTIGWSATPCRLDGRGLGDVFGDLVVGPSPMWLIEQGHLARYRAFAPSTFDRSGIRRIGGDLNGKQVEERLARSTIYGDAVANYAARTPGLLACAFCINVEASKAAAARYRAAGFPAASIDGAMKPGERTALLEGFAARRIKVLTSCDLVSEGFDLPAIEVGIMLRPTASLSLFIQQAGRVLRVAPDKPHAWLFDHVGNFAAHGPVCMPREWSLDTTRKGAAKGGAEVRVRTCPECFAVQYAGVRTCASCGHAFKPQGRDLGEIQDNLVEIDTARAARDHAAARKREIAAARTREDLQRIAQERGYKPGWVEHMVRVRAGRRG